MTDFSSHSRDFARTASKNASRVKFQSIPHQRIVGIVLNMHAALYAVVPGRSLFRYSLGRLGHTVSLLSTEAKVKLLSQKTKKKRTAILGSGYS